VAKSRIIIVGGGFGGVKCAQTLLRECGEAEIVLFNAENHMVFSPLLAEVVGSSISPLDVVVPLRQLLPGIFCRTEEVCQVDLAANAIEYWADDGDCSRMPYDQLVLACGNSTNLNIVPGMADHAFPLKSVGDAAALRSQIIQEMERAEVCADADRKRWHLTFIIVGGGYSGAEAAGEINDLVRSSARYFHNFARDEVQVILIHSRDQILPEISPNLRTFAAKKMQQAGVTLLLNARVSSATPQGVGLQDGRFIRGGTVVCTIGNSSNPLVDALNVPKEKGRLRTDPDMRMSGFQNVWAIGDCGYIINAHDGQPSPTTGQFAERQGRQCAQNIARVLRRHPTRPFAFKALGELCSIGGHNAVADLFGTHISGFLAWFVWRGVYLFKLPTWARRLQVGFDWAWLLLFPRDLAHVRTRTTDRVTRAHYDAGDYIIRKGEPPTYFYALEKGEVEIVRPTNGSTDGEVIAVLGPGSFFGEKALLSNEPRVMSVRARSDVQVLVMGKNVFTQVSEALAPLRDALAQTLNRRLIDPWKNQPEVYALLTRTPVKTLMEPVPLPLLKPTTTFRDVGRAFVEYGHEFFYVSEDGQSLDGIVTITDLVRTRSTGQTAATEFMTRHPVALTPEDNCAIAATVAREYRLKTLPVVESTESRRLVGCIRVRRLLAYVFKELERGRDVIPARDGGSSTSHGGADGDEKTGWNALPQGAAQPGAQRPNH
jgi:NADH dehydrogenase